MATELGWKVMCLNRERPGGRGRAEARLALRLFVGAVVALWTIDVILNLGFLRDLLLHRQALGSPRDFAGLMLGDLQIAVGIAVIAWLGGKVLSVVSTRGGRNRESVALLCSAMVCLVVLVNTGVWYDAASTLVEKMIAPAVVGLLAWPVMRLLLAARPLDSVAAVSEWALVPALLVGFASDTLGQARVNRLPEAAVSAGAVVVLLFAFTRCLKPRRNGRGHRLLWYLVSAACLLGGVACGSYETYGHWGHEDVAVNRSGGRPDIVLIVLDTVRADHLACCGYARNTMPALEEWATGGSTATRAISPAGWTSPAHASIFSGRTASGHGIHNHSPLRESTRVGGEVTRPVDGVSWLPDLLRAEGYYCLAVSANPLALPAGVTGFDRVIIPVRVRWHHSSFPTRAERLSPLMQSISERIRWRMPYVDAEGIVRIVRRALPRDGRQLFLFVNLMDAHSPYNPPARALSELGIHPQHLFSRYQTDGGLSLRWESLPAGRKECVADLYDGELRWLDMQLVPLLEWIDAQLGESAVIIVTSDHGEELGEQGRVGHLYGLPQSIIHVPLFVRCASLSAGELSEPVSTRQLFGFIRSCAGGSVPSADELLGTGPLALVSERYRSAASEVTFGWKTARHWISLIDGRYKAVGPSQWGAELYDIEAGGFDCEVTVADSLAGRALLARIDEHWEESWDRRAEPTRGSLTRRETEALRALGYLQ